MRFKKNDRLALSLIMTFFISNVPSVVIANQAVEPPQMPISSRTMLDELTHAEAKAIVFEYLQKDDVQSLLIKQGISPSEAADRLANLSTTEIQQLALQAKEARAGGDVLLTVLLVLLIIYFVQRV